MPRTFFGYQLVKVPGRTEGNRRGGRKRALAALLLIAVSISGLVAADVILSYQGKTSVGNSVTTPFYFQDGSNYGAATGAGVAFLTITCSGSEANPATNCGGVATAGQTGETLAVSGISSVPTYLVDVSDYWVMKAYPAGTHTFTIPAVTTSVTTAYTGVTCAYAFFSTVKPQTTVPQISSVSPVGGAACGSGVYEPTVTGGNLEDIDLVSGAVANPATGQAGVTYVAAGGTLVPATGTTAAATILIYISVVLVTSSAGPTGATTFSIVPVTV
jgi:hypothetical protein